MINKEQHIRDMQAELPLGSLLARQFPKESCLYFVLNHNFVDGSSPAHSTQTSDNYYNKLTTCLEFVFELKPNGKRGKLIRKKKTIFYFGSFVYCQRLSR